jgi:hypothetical protein
MKVSRRNLLKGLGSAALFSGVGGSIRARAAGTVAPLRLIQIWTPYHLPEQLYHPQLATGGMAPAGSNFTLNFTNSVLAPLSSYQSKMILFRGLNYTDPAQFASSGHATSGTMFTGAKCKYDSNRVLSSPGTSIDQYLFSRMAHSGSLQPMVVGAMPYLYGQDDPLSFVNGVGIHAEGNPQSTFNAYFANFKPPTSGGGGTPAPPDTTAVNAYNRRKAALAMVKMDLNNLIARLSNMSEQQKLTQHMTALNGLQSQLDAGAPQANPPAQPMQQAAACVPPAKTSIPADTGPANGNIDWSKLPSDLNSFSTLITQAFACDITRFATYRMAYDADEPAAVNFMSGLQNFGSLSSNWHDYTHSTTGEAGNSRDVLMSHYQNYWVAQVKTLLDKLAATVDPYNASQTLLDNTVVLLTNEHGIQTPGVQCHSYKDAPFILLGGCGGLFQMGRIFEATPRSKGVYAGVPHNALLATIVNAFETNQQAFNPNYVPKLLTQYGDYAAAPLNLA